MAHLEIYWVVAGMHWKPCISRCGFLFFCFCCIFCCKFHVGGVKQLLLCWLQMVGKSFDHNTQRLCLGINESIWISHGWRGVFVVSTGFVQFHSPTLPLEIWHFNKQTTRYKSQDANTKLGSTKARKPSWWPTGWFYYCDIHCISSGKAGVCKS